MDKIISTGAMIGTYLEANGFSGSDLVSLGVPEMFVNRMLGGECRLTLEMARAIHALIPGLSVEFLMSYDRKCQGGQEKRRICCFRKVTWMLKLLQNKSDGVELNRDSKWCDVITDDSSLA
jgi:plasmid maintenance system antidote protein VapI